LPADVGFRLVPHTEAMAAAGDPRHRVPGSAGAARLAEIGWHRDPGLGGDRRAGEGGAAAQLIGFAIGSPLEASKDVEGCDGDPLLGHRNTMYSVSVTVAPGYQGTGIGRRLKELQLRDARGRRTAAGEPRYLHVTGRNRIGRTAQMTHLNRVFGAHVVSILTGQYRDRGPGHLLPHPLGGIGPIRCAAPRWWPARAPLGGAARRWRGGRRARHRHRADRVFAIAGQPAPPRRLLYGRRSARSRS
jgi:GNAT superfamily N-acetyltransferase